MTDLHNDDDRARVAEIAARLKIEPARILADEAAPVTQSAPEADRPTPSVDSMHKSSFGRGVVEGIATINTLTRAALDGTDALNMSTAALKRAGEEWDELAKRALLLAIELDPATVKEAKALPLLEGLDLVLARARQRR